MDWRRLELHGLSPDAAFEALCTHLFDRWLRRQYPDLVGVHALDGCGGDGGVEAFGVLASGKEVGLQCKWFQNFRDPELKKLSASVDQARERHPDMDVYVVAFPMKLKAAKSSRAAVSQLDRWKSFTNEHPELRFDLWDRHVLDLELASQIDLQAHWFGEWFAVAPKNRYRRAVQAFVHRYSPKDPLLAGDIEREVGRHLRLPDACTEAITRVDAALRRGARMNSALLSLHENPEFANGASRDALLEVERLLAAASSLLANLRDCWTSGILAQRVFDLTDVGAVDALTARLGRCDDDDSDPFESARRALEELDSWLSTARRLDQEWLDGGRPLVIVGQPGCGKTSGVIATARLHAEVRDMPVFLLSARDLDPQDGLQAILARAIDRPTASVDVALAAMEAEAHAAEVRRRLDGGFSGPHPVRTLLIIDGLDESRPPGDAWTRVVAELAEMLRRYPRIQLATSVRASSAGRCIPAGAAIRVWRVAPTGDVNVLRLLRAYSETYKITIEDVPLLAGTLRTPLAVRLLSRLFEGRSVAAADIHCATLPQLVRAWLDELDRELRADEPSWFESEQTVLRSVQLAASVLVERGGPIEQERLVEALRDALGRDAITPARALKVLERACEYAVLDHYGVPSRDPLAPSQFLFDLGDETIADFLVGREVARRTGERVKAGLAAPEPAFLARRRDAAVFAAAFLLDEGISVGDAGIWPTVPPKHRAQLLLQAATWAAPVALAPLKVWVEHLFTASMVGTRDVTNDLVLPTSRRRDHPFGAAWLHRMLSGMTTQQRDILWSCPDDLPRNHGAAWEGRQDLKVDDLELWKGDPWWGAPTVVAWTLSSLVTQRVLASRWKLARWATSDPHGLCLLIECFGGVDDPQLQEELLLVAAEVSLRYGGDGQPLLDLARLVDRRVFGGDGAPVSTNLLSRVAGRIVIEQVAAREPSIAAALLARARPPYPPPKVLLEMDVSTAAAVSAKPSPHSVEMLDWDLWSYVVDRPATRFIHQTRQAYRLRTRTVSRHNVDPDVQALVKTGRISLNSKARKAALRSWAEHARRGRRAAAKRDTEVERTNAILRKLLDEVRTSMAAEQDPAGPAPDESEVQAGVLALLGPAPSTSEEFPHPVRQLLARYAMGYRVQGLTFPGMIAGIVVAHVRRHGWDDAIHTMDPRGGTPGERLGLDVAIQRKYHQARHGSRSQVAQVAEKYAFTGKHELLGYLASVLPWWNRHTAELGPCEDEGEIASDLLQGFPSRREFPGDHGGSEPWAPALGSLGPEVGDGNPMERSCQKLVALALPLPEQLVAGPRVGSVVLAAETVRDSFGSDPHPALWISALAAPKDQIELLARDLAAGVDPRDSLHESFQTPEGTYVPTDLVAVSQWIPLENGHGGYVTVNATGSAQAIELVALAGKNLDHDGESEVHCLFPGEFLRRVWPVVRTDGGDDARGFLDAGGRTRAVSESTSGDRTWEDSSNALFVDLSDLLATLDGHGLGAVWAIRLYWEVPGRLWSGGSGRKKEVYPSIRSREVRWIITNEGGLWRVLWSREEIERGPDDPSSRNPEDGSGTSAAAYFRSA